MRLFEEWDGAEEGRHILIAVARFLAAHAPTERSEFHTASIARRLHRGQIVHAEEPAANAASACLSVSAGVRGCRRGGFGTCN